jgi:hypothetical protein
MLYYITLHIILYTVPVDGNLTVCWLVPTKLHKLCEWWSIYRSAQIRVSRCGLTGSIITIIYYRVPPLLCGYCRLQWT